jgi:hypothetical protein
MTGLIIIRAIPPYSEGLLKKRKRRASMKRQIFREEKPKSRKGWPDSNNRCRIIEWNTERFLVSTNTINTITMVAPLNIWAATTWAVGTS